MNIHHSMLFLQQSFFNPNYSFSICIIIYFRSRICHPVIPEYFNPLTGEPLYNLREVV